MHLTKSTDMAAVVRKKQDEKYLQVLRELVTNGGGNRQCFDCGQKGPTYVNMTIGSFVCTRCSGVLRGLTPPHRVKSISMATFTQDDVDYLRSHGNDECAKTWLGLWDPKRAVHQDHRELMIDKYEQKRYYLEPGSPLKSLTNAVSLKSGSTAAAASGAGAAVSTTTGAGSSVAANSTANGSSGAYKNNGGDSHADLVHISNGFGHNANTNNNNKNHYRQHNATNAERSFQLTPPSTQRTTMNGLHKAVIGATASTSAKTTSAISRPQHHQQNGYSQSLQDAFMQKGNNNNINNNNNNNELNVLHMTTNRMTESSSATSVNGFGTDADFVADFGSANIFDATTVTRNNKMSSPPLLNGVGGAISSNGYARIQPLKQRQQQQQQQQQYQLLNGHGQLLNGNSSQSESIGNSTSENFADFEHAPIFNAAANYHFIRKNVIRRCAGGQNTDSENPSSNATSKATPPSPIRAQTGNGRSPSALKQSSSPNRSSETRKGSKNRQTEQSVIAEESADIRQATIHSAEKSNEQESIKSPDKLISSPIQTPGVESSNKVTTQKAVDELTCQLNAPQIFTFGPSATQAEYSGYCPQPRCTELTIMNNNNNNEAQNQDPNQDQGGFCGGNIPQIDWSQYANNTPCWPPGSSTCLQGNAAAEPMNADALAAKLQNPGYDPNQVPAQQIPTPFCPQVKFCPPMSCALPCLPPPCSPRVCPLPPVCSGNQQQQQPDATVAGLSYGPIPQQTIINTAQIRPQNGVGVGCGTQTEACLEPTPSYSTLYNRSYCQPTVCSYPPVCANPFLQQTNMVQSAQLPPPQTAPMPIPPECYNPFHPYCISGSCPKGCMPSNSIPVGDPIIDPSCNMHSPYNNCFCNNWCLPIPNNNSSRTMNNQQNKSQNNNNNNKLSSTPSEDRYAALKDLDEQLRESKAAATVVTAYGVDTFGNNTISNGVNPFNHQQVNPFQAATHGTSPSTAQNYFGQMTVISNSNGNGNGITSQQSTHTTTQYFNYSNGFGNTTATAGTATAIFPHTVMATGPSGCGFGMGALQPTAIAATGAGGGGAFNNPFSTTGAMNTNNPFL